MVKYPEPFRGKIITNNCTIQGSIKKRDILKARINDNDEYVLYILMNPSKADSIQSDRTINKILKFTREKYVEYQQNYRDRKTYISSIYFLFIKQILPNLIVY
ncbi:DUF1643 domain-containing protein [Paenibacillus sp. YYML68]|uniref:DUF1643 domain-containing protein n=1 Tax=Paenibacillus sp. YYML68 TaxID=2909250 RepID=UPI0037CA1F1C